MSAGYIVVKDLPVSLPTSANESHEALFFNVPRLNRDKPCVLLWNVDATHPVSLQITVNGHEIGAEPWVVSAGNRRAVHEVFPGTLLKDDGQENTLILSKTGGVATAAVVKIADLVLLTS